MLYVVPHVRTSKTSSLCHIAELGEHGERFGCGGGAMIVFAQAARRKLLAARRGLERPIVSAASIIGTSLGGRRGLEGAIDGDTALPIVPGGNDATADFTVRSPTGSMVQTPSSSMQPPRPAGKEGPAGTGGGAKQSPRLPCALDGSVRLASGRATARRLRPGADLYRGAERPSQEIPSFRRLPHTAFYQQAPVHEMGAGRDLAQSRRDGVAEAAQRQAGGVDGSRGEAALPPSPWSSPFLLACLFVAGIASGVGAAHVLGNAAITTDIGLALARPARLLKQPQGAFSTGLQPGADAGRDAATGIAMGDNGSAAGVAHPPDAVSSRNGRDVAAPPRASTALWAIRDKLERQLAKHQLDQPEGDNALETYRELATQWPNDVAPAGQRLSEAFWREAEQARAAAHWDEALRYLNILKTLPPPLPPPGGVAGGGAIGSPP
jgi:hypothetical protein